MQIEYLLMKKHDDFCQSVEQFKSLLSSNVRVAFEEDILKIDGKKLQYSISVEQVEASKEIMYHFQIRGLNVQSEEEQVQLLESADELLRRINECYQTFRINVIWDDVSIFYGKRLYPELVLVENYLRKIIYLFMLKTVGSEWSQKNTPKEVRESIDKTLEKNKLKQVDTDCLYYADFITLSAFFFSKYPLNSNYPQLIEKLKLAENREEKKLNKLLETYEARSNWERYFSNQIRVEDLEGKWKRLYGYRNQVAHSKRMVRKEYLDAKQLLDELIGAFEDCLQHMDTVELTEEQAEAVEEIARETIGVSENQENFKRVRPEILIEYEQPGRTIEWTAARIASQIFPEYTSFARPNVITTAFSNMHPDIIVPMQTIAKSIAPMQTAAQAIAPMQMVAKSIAPMQTVAKSIAPMQTVTKSIASMQPVVQAVAPLAGMQGKDEV